MVERVIGWLSGERLVDCLFEWLNSWSSGCLSSWLSGCFSVCLSGWFSGSLSRCNKCFNNSAKQI